MSSRLVRSAAAAAAVVAVAALASGCGGSPSRVSATTGAPRTAQAAWHQVVLCMRAHGMPGVPEPTIDASGNATFPGLSDKAQIPAQTRRACQALYNRLIPNGQSHSFTQADLNRLLQFARCMRSHGIHDWPDPNANGEFLMPPRLRTLLKSAMRSQMMACDRYNPDPRGRIYGATP